MLRTAMVMAAALMGVEPQVYVLRPGADVYDVAAADIDGDGLKDICALSGKEDSYPAENALALFLANSRGEYPTEPSAVLPVDPTAGVVFLAETDGASPREIVVADSQGADVYRFQGGRFELVAQPRFRNLFPTGATRPLFLPDAAEDVNGDGIDEWFFPIVTGFQILTLAGPLATVECHVVSETRPSRGVYIYHRFPARYGFDQEGQSAKGLAFLSDRFVDFTYGPSWGERLRVPLPMTGKESGKVSVQMADLDGDGALDIILTQVKGNVNMEVKTSIYLAEAPFRYAETPTAALEAKGAIASPFISDVDGDGRPEIIFFKVPIGLKMFVSYFLRQKLSVHIDVYFFDGQTFRVRPGYSQNLVLNVPEDREQIAYAMGDFNGDGRIDLAFSSGSEELVFHAGGVDKFTLTKPWLVLEMPSLGVARTDDLNGNGRDDLILFHPDIDHRDRIEVIVF